MVPRRLRAQRAAGRDRLTPRRAACALLLAVVLGVGVAACDGGSDSSSESTSTRTRESSTSSTSTSGEPASAATTSTTGETSLTVGIICTSPEDAAPAVVNAWTAGDRAAASRCASDAVVAQLFTTSGAGNTWTAQACDHTDPAAVVCPYTYEGGAAFLTVTGSDTGGWKVTGLRYAAD